MQGDAEIVQANAIPAGIEQPPVIFFPGIPSILLPNPLVKPDTRPGFLGVQLDTDGDAQAEDEIAIKDAAKKITGVGITSVIEGGPAEKAGLKEGDRVLMIDGKEAKNSVQLREMIRALKPEQDVKMTVRRDGKEIAIKAKLDAWPEQIADAQMLQLNFGGRMAIPQTVPGVVTFRSTASPARSPSTSAMGVLSDRDSVSLRDGNRFLGKIRGMDPAKGLLLERDGLPDLELIEEEITGLTFAERGKTGDASKPANATPLPKVTLQLRDGSILNGDALTMAHDTITITLPAGQGLPAGQRIEIPREAAQSVMLSDGESPQIYEGPAAMTGWTSGRSNQGQWEYRDGMLRCISNGPIGRDLGLLPDPLDVSFDVNFPRQMQHLGVVLFSNSVNESGIGALSLNFSPSHIYGSHYDGKQSNQYNENLEQNAPQNLLSKPETVRYRILVDRVNGSALIYINGVKRADWKLSKVKPADVGKCGGAFSLTPHASTSNATFQVGRVRILPWNGKEPGSGAEPPVINGDQVLNSAGAETNGTLGRITDTEVLFATPKTGVRREKTVFVHFAEPSAPKENPAAVAMARLRNGSEISASQVSGTGETFTLTTRCGPQITMPLAMLRSLDFLPRAGQAPVPAKDLDVLTLTDGTQFAGRVLLPIEGANAKWEIAASKAPLEFPSEKLAGILLRGTDGARKATPLKGDSVLRLGNGDWLPGEVVSLDAGQLVMKTDLAQLNLPVSGLRSLYLNPSVAATLADGATGPDLWSEGWSPSRTTSTRQVTDAAAKTERPWKYFDGSYSVSGIPRNSQQTIARHWPPYAGAYALNFDVITPSRSLYFNAQIYNARNERTFSISASGTRMHVYFNPGSSRINRAGMGQKQFQLENMKESTGGSVRVSIVLDRPAKTFRVLISGKEAGKIAFKEDDAKEALDACGMTLTTSYYSSVSGRQSRVERIWLAPCGAISAAVPKVEAEKAATPASEAGASPAPASIIYLANGDEFSGAIEKITADHVTVNSDVGPLEFPGNRVAWFHFPGSAESVSEHFPRLRFHDRGLLSVNDLHIGSERVQCKTLGGQALDFPLGVVKEVVWRPAADK